MLAIAAVACQKENPETPTVDPLMHPFKEVVAKDGVFEIKANINDAQKTIKFEDFQDVKDLKNIEVKFTLAEGAKLVSPKTIVGKFDLTNPIEVVVNNKVTDVKYTLSANKPGPNVVIAAGYELTDKFGALPSHIRAYENAKMGTSKQVTAWIVEVANSKDLQLEIVGTGEKENVTVGIKGVAAEHPDYNFYMNGVCGQKSGVVKDGKFVCSASTPTAAFAIDTDGKFVISPQKKVYDEADKEKKNPKIARYNENKEIINSDWKPKYMFGGTELMVAGGKKLPKEIRDWSCNNYAAGWYGTAVSSRAAVGVNKAGTKAFFFVCNKGTDGKDGLTMDQVIEAMLSIKCETVMFMEGSGSANMLINAKPTFVENPGEKKTSAVLCIK